MKHTVRFILLIILVLSLAGCNSGGNSDIATTPNEDAAQMLGDIFLNSNIKIRSVITDTSTSPSREVVVEIYVDKDGDGNGMLGYAGEVYEVYISRNVLYVVVDKNNIVCLTDITGRLLASGTIISGRNDLENLGFVMSQGSPVSYAALAGSLNIQTKFAYSTTEFPPFSFTPSSSLTLRDAINYIDEYNKVVVDPPVEVPPEEPSIEDFYLNSKYGVHIDGKTYSIGDTANPFTYFANGDTPEGLLTSTAQKQDSVVEFLHVSYINLTGRSLITSVDNYVQAIKTSGDWVFCGVESGISEQRLQLLMGYRLSESALAQWEPIDKTFVFIAKQDNIYKCTVGEYNVEFRCKDNTLYELFIEKPLVFKEG